jgi:hypothetical protein
MLGWDLKSLPKPFEKGVGMPSSNATTDKAGIWKTVIFTLGNTPPVSTTNTVTVASRYVRAKTWLHTPNYRSLKAKHDLPMNAYSFSITENDWARGSVDEQTYNTAGALTNRGSHSGQFGSGASAWDVQASVVGPTGAEIASCDARASTKMLLALKNQKVNALQAFAEREQTFKTITQSATSVYEALRSLKRGDLNGAVRALGGRKPSRRAAKGFKKLFPTDPKSAVANLWLSWSYGWKPLLNDIYGTAEHYNQQITKDRVLRATATVAISGKSKANTIKPVTGWEMRHTTTRSWRYSCKFVIFYKVVNDTSKTIAQLGLMNPAVIAWELLPFSFVADWFLPVGNFLSSLDATVGLVFVKGCKTTCNKAKASKVSGAFSTAPLKKVSASVVGNIRTVAISRSALASFPSVTAPVWKNPFSKAHAASAIALVIQSFHKR